MTQAAVVETPLAVPVARSRAFDYVTLLKPRITSLVAATAAGGYYVGSGTGGVPMLHAIAGTAVCAAGASALNMALERRPDSLMERTMDRPVPAGRVSVTEAFAVGALLSIAGVVYLALAANWLAAALGLAAVVGYAFVYTPLKTRTHLATLIGAVPGALPPVIGYAAGAAVLDRGAAALFLILFFWQLPHFLALAWLYREQYAKAGVPVLPVLEPDGGSTARQVILQTLALIVASALPAWSGLGRGYLIAAVVLGAAFLVPGIAFARQRSRERAVRLFLASVVYLPLLFGAMALGRAGLI